MNIVFLFKKLKFRFFDEWNFDEFLLTHLSYLQRERPNKVNCKLKDIHILKKEISSPFFARTRLTNKGVGNNGIDQ